MSRPDECEIQCPVCEYKCWETEANVRNFSVSCGKCGQYDKRMRRTGQKRVDGELVVPEPAKVVPTAIPVDGLQKIG